MEVCVTAVWLGCMLLVFVCVQIQAYNLAIEQHRNFELRVPANVNASSSAFKDAHEALMRSNSGSTGHAGSVDSTSQSLAQHGSGGPQQGPMHGVRGWMSGNTDSSSQQQLQPAAAAVAGEAGSKQQLQEPQQQANAAVIAATAAATERTAQLHGDHASSSCRRSFGGGMRYIRFQFRSVASVGSHMTPAVSVPPALVSADRANYYWATVDVPTSGSLGDQDPQCSYTFGAQVNAVSAARVGSCCGVDVHLEALTACRQLVGLPAARTFFCQPPCVDSSSLCLCCVLHAVSVLLSRDPSSSSSSSTLTTTSSRVSTTLARTRSQGSQVAAAPAPAAASTLCPAVTAARHCMHPCAPPSASCQRTTPSRTSPLAACWAGAPTGACTGVSFAPCRWLACKLTQLPAVGSGPASATFCLPQPNLLTVV